VLCCLTAKSLARYRALRNDLSLNEILACHEVHSRRNFFGRLDRTSRLSDLNATGAGKDQRANPNRFISVAQARRQLWHRQFRTLEHH
jgi:hypothetical protein